MTWDFAVAGGGPVGLGTAIYAAMQGCSVVLVERARGVVDKACGEGLMPPAVHLLRELGVTPPGHPFAGIRYVDGTTRVAADFTEGPGLGVRRTALSAALLDRARSLPITLLHDTEVLGVTDDRLDTSRGPLQARWILAADGLHSRLRKVCGFGLRRARWRRFGIRRHFRATPADRVEVHWADGVEAYVTPVADDTVGVAFLWSGGKGDMETFLARFPDLRLGEPVDDVRGAGPLEIHPTTQRRGRVLLVGDAAGYLDAITGEGVSLGLAAGQAAVRAALANRPETYPAAWRALTRRHRFLTGLLLHLAARPALRRTVLARLARHPGAMRTFLAFNSGARGWLAALGGGLRLLT